MRVSDPLQIRVLSHNIRYATNAPFKGEEKWDVRKPYLINELCYHTAHCAESFICLQEVLHQQLVDILAGLSRNKRKWEYVGVGRDDGSAAGEYSPIIYNPTVWELKMQKTKWLSETPDRPSRGWDAACIRILTIAMFQHRSTRRKLIAMNTHLDDQGSKSRLEAAKIILGEIRQFTAQESHGQSPPILVAGDFNSEPDQEAYKEMTSRDSPMVDVHSMVPEIERYGHSNTFTGFDPETERPTRIDFIFVNRGTPKCEGGSELRDNMAGTPWLMEGYAVLPNRFEDGMYNSDHRAVIGDFTIL